MEKVEAERDLTAEEFRNWLEALLNGRQTSAVADCTTRADELVNGELRESLVAFYPGGAFVITVAKVER